MREEVEKLIPVEVGITSDLKVWGKFSNRDGGTSEGSVFSLTFKVPEGMEGQLLTKLMLRHKYKLDLLCLLTERLRGALSDQEYKAKTDLLKNAFVAMDGAMGRKPE